MPEDEHLNAILSDQDKREVLNDRLLKLSVPAHLALMMAESAMLTHAPYFRVARRSSLSPMSKAASN